MKAAKVVLAAVLHHHLKVNKKRKRKKVRKIKVIEGIKHTLFKKRRKKRIKKRKAIQSLKVQNLKMRMSTYKVKKLNRRIILMILVV